MGSSVILSVGDELLAGRIHDTNATWLATALRRAGFPSVRRETVGDDPADIAAALRRASEAHVVIVSGGLGPTRDDVTREGLARALDVPITRSLEAQELVEAFFAKGGRVASDSNLVQADLPLGSVPLQNPWGSAPGVRLEVGIARVFALPGVPRELKGMFDLHVVPVLASHPEREPTPVRESLTVIGVPESELGSRLKDLMTRGRNPSVGSYPGVARVVVAVEGRASPGQAEDSPELANRVLADLAEIRHRLGPAILGDGELEIHEVVARLLMDSGTTVAVAESLTGGRVADLLVSVAGISSVFLAGFATYSNSMKERVLGVSSGTLQTDGAVSAACAREMAEGARRISGAAVALATTGIAGPSGGTEEKPVGLVFLALATPDGTVARKLQILGGRAEIRERACTAALDLLRHHLLFGGEGALIRGR